MVQTKNTAGMKTECGRCPFKKVHGWYGAYGTSQNAVSKIMALKATDEAGLFSCHLKHPRNNVFMETMILGDSENELHIMFAGPPIYMDRYAAVIRLISTYYGNAFPFSKDHTISDKHFYLVLNK